MLQIIQQQKETIFSNKEFACFQLILPRITKSYFIKRNNNVYFLSQEIPVKVKTEK